MTATERMLVRTAIAAARTVSSRVRESIGRNGLNAASGINGELARMLVEQGLAIEELVSALDRMVPYRGGSRSALVPAPRARDLIAPAPAPEPPPAAVPPPAMRSGPEQVKASRRPRAIGRDELPRGMSVAEQQRIARGAAADEPWERGRPARQAGGQR